MPEQDSTPEFVPDCTVRYDEWAGCGVNVQRRVTPTHEFIDLTFLTRAGTVETHFLTIDQAVQLRAAVDAVSRIDTPWCELRPSLREQGFYVRGDDGAAQRDAA